MTDGFICPLCDPKDVIAESESVLLMNSPWQDEVVVVTLKEHKNIPTTEEYREALTLAGTYHPQAMFGECSDAIGHWAANVIKFGHVGSSRMYKEKP